tara:strand:+ start:332 stop:628 length:297 start_codon:yes stop_codon:yes gene_type:complete
MKGYLKRRQNVNPLNVGIVCFVLPLSNLYFAISHRSWKLAVLPIVSVLVIGMWHKGLSINADELPDVIQFYQMVSVGLIGFSLSRSNKISAREIGDDG